MTGYKSSYGLGWLVDVQKGLTQIYHSGGTAGFGSLLGFYPEQQCGFVILTNGTGGHVLNDVLRRKILELWFETSEKSSEIVIFSAQEYKKYADAFKEKLSAPSADWMQPFLGKHHNDELGFFEITQDQGHYFLDLNDGICKTQLMVHEGHSGEKTLTWIEPPSWGTRMIPIEGNSFKLTEEQHSYDFRKVAE